MLVLSLSLSTAGCWGRENERMIAHLQALNADLKAQNTALQLEIRDLKDKLAEREKSKP